MLKSIFFIFITISVIGQNTIGTLINTENSLNGYTLFTYKKETYLINNCGEIINQWTSLNNEGKSVYLLENGNLLRAAVAPNPGNIVIPGIGGRIELFDWDGNLIWSFDYASTTAIQHHDIYPMPNGNILILAVSIISDTEAIQMGRNPANLNGPVLYNEQIIEIEPVGTNDANIVWEWNIKDHLIQDFDNTKDNFGVVSENPQLLDINYLGISNGGANWIHANSIQYNEQLDQIIISARQLSEFYIIDHSTTTTEAATSSGGIYQKGGDILYRWGNPIAYKQGTVSDQKLFGQHFPHWIQNNLVDGGKIIIFNNGINRTPGFSEVDIITPPTSSTGVYNYSPNSAYGPTIFDYVYTAPVKTNFYSPILSSAQRLSNGNTLICEGTSGHFFELDANKNIVWEYINPVGPDGIMSQGDDPEFISNVIFRAEKFSTDYPAFIGRDLTPGLPIELNPDLTQCAILGISANNFNEIKLYPNPVKNILTINTNNPIIKVEVFDLLGKLVKTSFNNNQIDVSNLKSSIYIVKLYSENYISVKKIIKL